MKSQRRQSSRVSGQALVEFAAVLPFLLILAVGVIEFGRYAYIGILVGSAARAGTAYGAQSLPLSADTAGITAAAQADYKNNGQDPTLLQTTNQTLVCGCDSAGAVVTANCDPTINVNAGKCTGGAHWVVTLSVTASGQFPALFRYPGIPTPITITRISSMRVAQN